MKKQNIDELQNYCVGLLRGDSNRPLAELAQDTCSELSRLAGCWVLRRAANTRAWIAKGDDVMNQRDKSHDVLVIQSGAEFVLIDPSVRQFFERDTILIGTAKTQGEILTLCAKTYGGGWRISEMLTPAMCEQEKTGWLNTIRESQRS